MTISVIIPNYNNGVFLKECIDSVFAQTYQPLECIVVDDGSNDNSIEVLTQLKLKYCNLYYYSIENSGPSVARNYGIKKANGDYIALLDSDDYWSSKKLENQVKLIKTSKEIISSHSDNFNEYGEIFPLKKYQLPPYTPYDFIAKNAIIGSCSSILFPKSIIKEIGYYDPTLRVSEDQEFHFRMALAGYNFKHSHNCDVHIRWHNNNSTKNLMKVLYFNLIAFEQQLQLLKQSYPEILNNRNDYNKAIIERIGTISYWASEAKKPLMKAYLRLFLKIEIGRFNYYKHKLKSFISRLIN